MDGVGIADMDGMGSMGGSLSDLLGGTYRGVSEVGLAVGVVGPPPLMRQKAVV